MNKYTISLLICFMIIVVSGCHKENSEVNPKGNVVLYKTTMDYFDKMNINLKDGKAYYLPDVSIKLDDQGNIKYLDRVKLIDGYILSTPDYGIQTAFLDYTIEEFYNLTVVQKIHLSMEELQNKIIDASPFIELYMDTIPLGEGFGPKDSLTIIEIIKNGEIENHFKRIEL